MKYNLYTWYYKEYIRGYKDLTYVIILLKGEDYGRRKK